MSKYYATNHLKSNPAKTQLCSFRDACRKQNVSWDGHKLMNHCNLVYLGFLLDRTLTFKKHLMNTKANINTCNNILHKLINSKWGAVPSTVHAIALTLCFSTAEYAFSTWSRSCHTKLIDIALNDTCHEVT